jgi:NAD(P)-dependent dehydrogenase (short-subunit alcohol dehydrogenase family)
MRSAYPRMNRMSVPPHTAPGHIVGVVSPSTGPSEWDPTRLPDLSGRRYLITGANRGVGYFASEQLLRAGATVIMTGRNPNRLSAARAAVEGRTADTPGRGVAETLLLDTSNLGSVRAAAASIRAKRRLDGLVLNAGIVHPPKERTLTQDGHELVLATNVLGHYALAGELLTTLAARGRAGGTGGGRMVWLGSLSTGMWAYDPVDPELREGYTAWRAYVQSKVATSAMGFEADRRLRAERVPVVSVVVHPGYAPSGRTAGIRGINEPGRLTRFVDNLQAPINQSKEHGAWSIVRALVDPEVEGGQYVGPRLGRGVPKVIPAPKITRREELGDRLWHFCEDATGIHWPWRKAAVKR